MLKKANENPSEKLILTEKLTNMIIKKSYLKQYFNILQENLKLNIELNNGSSKEGLTIEDEDLLNDINDSDENNIFAMNQSNNLFDLNDNNEDVDLQENDNLPKNFSNLNNDLELEDDQEISINNKFLK